MRRLDFTTISHLVSQSMRVLLKPGEEERKYVFVSKGEICMLVFWTKFCSSSNKAPVCVIRGFMRIWTGEFGHSHFWRRSKRQVLWSELGRPF